MALNYDYITAIVRDEYIPKLVDNIYEKSAFLSMLRRDGRVQAATNMSSTVNGGTKIIQPLLYSKNTARGNYANYDTVDVTPPDNITAAEYVMYNYYVTISISQEDELKVNGDNAVINLLNTKMEESEMSLKDLIATDLFTGSGSKIIGLDTAIGTGTYGGIAGATYTWWNSGVDATAHTAANMVDSTNASYIHKLLRAGYKSCKHKGEMPNLILTSQDTFDLYEQTLQASARYPMTERGKFMADAGFDVIEFRGIPIVVDDYISDTADAMYMLNTNYFTHYYHPENNFKMHEWVKPSNQLARVTQITYTTQNAISNRRMFYRWSDLNN